MSLRHARGPTFFTDATGILLGSRIPALATDTTHYAFGQGTRIEFQLTVPCRVELQVFDARGRRIRILHQQFTDAGHHEVAWDGRADSGDLMPGGNHLVRLSADKRTLSQRFVLLRCRRLASRFGSACPGRGRGG